MKIIAVSDLHGYLPQGIPECDLLIIAGDICPHFGNMRTKPGSPADVQGQLGYMYGQFKQWLKQQPATMIVGIWGNHDFVGMHYPCDDLPWKILQSAPLVVNGLFLYGTPWTPRYYDWAFMDTEEGLMDRLHYLPEKLDILISHGPPLWYCDRPASIRGDHVGSQALFDKLRTMVDPPKHVVCGHIHGGKGWAKMDGHDTQVWNVSSINEAYLPYHQMWTEIQLETESTDGIIRTDR
jgi:Icc-related predicted phosphoesterase